MFYPLKCVAIIGGDEQKALCPRNLHQQYNANPKLHLGRDFYKTYMVFRWKQVLHTVNFNHLNISLINSNWKKKFLAQKILALKLFFRAILMEKDANGYY